MDGKFIDGILVHYGEIALKGKNRSFFEEKLVDNLRSSLEGLSFEKVKRSHGRIFVELSGVPASDIPNYRERMDRVFGIANYSFVRICSRDIQSMKRTAREMVEVEEFESFKIEARRADKGFHLNSVEINEKVGAEVQNRLDERGAPKEVDLENPDLTLFIELTNKKVFLYKEKFDGPGGMPVSTAGKVVGLISAGIDSPVAAWQIMKRGAEVIFVHFHSFPRTDRASQGNVRKVVEVFSRWQGSSKLYLVNIRAIQRRIIIDVPKRLRIIFYRRIMLKASEKIAEREEAKGLVTGDSLAQVSSQTLENLRATNETVSPSLPVYRPNIGMDKREIESRAREIGTYEISSRSSRDCCVYMRPEHPETKASLEEIREAEESLQTDALTSEALADSEVEQFG